LTFHQEVVMKLSDLQRETLSFEAAVDGGMIKGKFRPRAYTPKVEQLVVGAKETGSPAASLAEALSCLLDSWDLSGEDDKPYPCNAEALLEVPVVVLGEVFKSIARAMAPKATSAEPSGAG